MACKRHYAMTSPGQLRSENSMACIGPYDFWGECDWSVCDSYLNQVVWYDYDLHRDMLVYCVLCVCSNELAHYGSEMCAAYAACFLTRKCASYAFAKKFRSTTTSDLIENVGRVFRTYFESDDKHQFTFSV